MHYKIKYVFYFLLMLGAIAALGWLVMTLWNWIIPSIFTSAQPIDYFRSLGLLVLCRVLFGGFHGRGGWHHHHKMHRWHQMSDEEKEKFRQGMMGFRGRARDHESETDGN